VFIKMLLVALILTVTPVASPAQARPAKQKHMPAFVLGSNYGPKFTGFGMDLKKSFHNKVTLARTTAEPLELSHAGNRLFRFVRVPYVVASVTPDGHFDPEKGAYERQAQIMLDIKRRNPGVRFYLNRKNCCADVFPASLRNPGAYGRFIAEVAHYFRAWGVPTQFIGPDNENRARFTPTQFDTVMRSVRQNYRYPFITIGNDSWSMSPSWVRNTRTLQVGAIHSNTRKWAWQADKIRAAIYAVRADGKPAWQTEFHWDHWSRTWFARNAVSLKQMLTQICWGLRSVYLWDMHQPAFKYAVMKSVTDSRCRRVTSKMKGVYTYANSKGHVWVINTGSHSYVRKVKAGRFGYTRWRGPTPSSGRASYKLKFPAKSITQIRLR
jgi:hypothetical protein